MTTDNDQTRFMTACKRFGIPCRKEGDRFFIMDEDVEREVVVCPPTEEEADVVHPCDVLIEDEAQLGDFEGGNLEVVLREPILDPVPADISGFKW